MLRNTYVKAYIYAFVGSLTPSVDCLQLTMLIKKKSCGGGEASLYLEPAHTHFASTALKNVGPPMFCEGGAASLHPALAHTQFKLTAL